MYGNYLSLKEKVILITGGARTLGWDMTEALAETGADMAQVIKDFRKLDILVNNAENIQNSEPSEQRTREELGLNVRGELNRVLSLCPWGRQGNNRMQDRCDH